MMKASGFVVTLCLVFSVAMSLKLAQLQDRFRATVLGFAVGDALGFPLRGLPPPPLIRLTGVADDFAARPRGHFAKGQFSDDTQMLLAAAEAVAREGRIDGRAIATQLSWLWQEGVVLQPPRSATDAAERLLAGTPWMSAGAPLGVRDPSCLSRGVVAGLWGDGVSRLAHDAQVLTVVTHKDPRCAAAVAAVGRVIQHLLVSPQCTGTELCEAASTAAAAHDADLADELYYLPRVFGWNVDRALGALRRVGVAAGAFDFEGGLPAHVTPVLLTALFVAIRETDWRAALALALRAGGEVDVCAGLVGALVGARKGTESLPARLRKNLAYGDALVDTADRLFDARVAQRVVVSTARPLSR
jgi:ADP-ribosyl-[dinitrogen reductase] hydrolase